MCGGALPATPTFWMEPRHAQRVDMLSPWSSGARQRYSPQMSDWSCCDAQNVHPDFRGSWELALPAGSGYVQSATCFLRTRRPHVHTAGPTLPALALRAWPMWAWVCRNVRLADSPCARCAVQPSPRTKPSALTAERASSCAVHSVGENSSPIWSVAPSAASSSAWPVPLAVPGSTRATTAAQPAARLCAPIAPPLSPRTTTPARLVAWRSSYSAQRAGQRLVSRTLAVPSAARALRIEDALRLCLTVLRSPAPLIER